MRGEVYMVKLDGFGSEQKGIRPVLVIQDDSIVTDHVAVAVMTTKRKKSNMPTHVDVLKEEGMKEDSVVMLEQIQFLDRDLLRRRMTRLSNRKMREVSRAISVSLSV